MQEMPAVVIRDEIFLEHDPGFGHPESPQRLRAIYKRIEKPDVKGLYQVLKPRMASKEELCWNHSASYVERIARTAGVSHYQLDPDTATSERSWEAACHAVGGVFEALDSIFSEKSAGGFALIRPPGHHAERDHAMGFCLFNNVALGAHYCLKRLGCKRVMIVDWDLHHGNGTQHSFYEDDSVLYFSTHQYPYYPGTGAVTECGKGRGEGFTVNCPMSAGAGDEEFAAVYNRLLTPIARQFSPDAILCSAGFDIYRDDPLGGMRVSIAGFSFLASRLLELSNELCPGRLLYCLEGGYDLTGLSEGVAAVLRVIGRNEQESEKDIVENLKNSDVSTKGLEDALDVQRRYWSSLG